MKILFLVPHKWPHVGGVERHTHAVSEKLRIKNVKVTTVSEEDIRYPHIKYLGLVYIWYWLFKHRSLIEKSDIIHCHDVFIWYLPFRFLYPKKVVYTTFHGWEGVWPIPWKNIFLKRLAAKLSWGNICIGHYIEKYYGINKADHIIYGAVTTPIRIGVVKEKGGVVFVGRLEEDTGVLPFLKWLRAKGRGLKVDFCGDGPLRKECEKYGKVHGFVNLIPFLEKAEYCVPGGYLSYIEAKSYGCKIKVFPDNPLKKDYWSEITKVKKFPTWDVLADEYISLWKLK